MKLREWRKKNRIALVILAGELDCSAAALSYIERGQRMPSMDMANRIVKATKGAVSYDDLHKAWVRIA